MVKWKEDSCGGGWRNQEPERHQVLSQDTYIGNRALRTSTWNCTPFAKSVHLGMHSPAEDYWSFNASPPLSLGQGEAGYSGQTWGSSQTLQNLPVTAPSVFQTKLPVTAMTVISGLHVWDRGGQDRNEKSPFRMAVTRQEEVKMLKHSDLDSPTSRTEDSALLAWSWFILEHHNGWRCFPFWVTRTFWKVGAILNSPHHEEKNKQQPLRLHLGVVCLPEGLFGFLKPFGTGSTRTPATLSGHPQCFRALARHCAHHTPIMAPGTARPQPAIWPSTACPLKTPILQTADDSRSVMLQSSSFPSSAGRV